MRAIWVRSTCTGQEDSQFELPVEEVATALDVSTDELEEAIRTEKIDCRELGTEHGQLVVQVEAYGRHTTIRTAVNT
jgi:hypothetical protein